MIFEWGTYHPSYIENPNINIPILRIKWEKENDNWESLSIWQKENALLDVLSTWGMEIRHELFGSNFAELQDAEISENVIARTLDRLEHQSFEIYFVRRITISEDSGFKTHISEFQDFCEIGFAPEVSQISKLTIQEQKSVAEMILIDATSFLIKKKFNEVVLAEMKEGESQDVNQSNDV